MGSAPTIVFSVAEANAIADWTDRRLPRKKDGELFVRSISARYRCEGAGPMKKPFPSFDSDEKLETFLDTADLDEYDLTAGALPRDDWFARYERFAKDASIHLRLPEGLLDAVRSQAAREKIPTQRLIREFIERGLRTPARRAPRASRLAPRAKAK